MEGVRVSGQALSITRSEEVGKRERRVPRARRHWVSSCNRPESLRTFKQACGGGSADDWPILRQVQGSGRFQCKPCAKVGRGRDDFRRSPCGAGQRWPWRPAPPAFPNSKVGNRYPGECPYMIGSAGAESAPGQSSSARGGSHADHLSHRHGSELRILVIIVAVRVPKIGKVNWTVCGSNSA